jgi:hypothetical protein
LALSALSIISHRHRLQWHHQHQHCRRQLRSRSHPI